jgi:hypothetical protein
MPLLLDKKLNTLIFTIDKISANDFPKNIVKVKYIMAIWYGTL